MTYWETSISMQPSKSKLIGASVIQKSLILGRAVSRRRPRDLLSLSLSCLPNAHTTNSPPRQINNLSWQPAVTNGPPPMPRLNYGTRRKRNRTLLTGGARWRLPESGRRAKVEGLFSGPLSPQAVECSHKIRHVTTKAPKSKYLVASDAASSIQRI